MPLPRRVTVLTVTGEEALARLVALADQSSAATRERDRLIWRSHAGGVSLRVIARAAGLSHVGVAKIVKRVNEMRKDEKRNG